MQEPHSALELTEEDYKIHELEAEALENLRTELDK